MTSWPQDSPGVQTRFWKVPRGPRGAAGDIGPRGGGCEPANGAPGGAARCGGPRNGAGEKVSPLAAGAFTGRQGFPRLMGSGPGTKKVGPPALLAS
mmetsp:Transcript_20345/g.38515  ORF Transcript_20345/g.38515 Transcript_20345/m.38515 type:complete len:96 (-) Transcript_20345:707-994(-)